MQVTLIGQTWFNAEAAHTAMEGFVSTSDDAEGLVEAAGRSCYQSFAKPNPETATNAGYISNILKQRHFSVLEHCSFTVYVTGVSRALTHELVRHRHLSFSQLSQRFVDESNAKFVLPPALMGRVGKVLTDLDEFISKSGSVYRKLVALLTEAGLTRKQAREAARAVMPNMTETKIVVTGNYRAWRHFLAVRGTAHADAEIRALAVNLLRMFKTHAPNSFHDMTIDVEGITEVIRI